MLNEDENSPQEETPEVSAPVPTEPEPVPATPSVTPTETDDVEDEDAEDADPSVPTDLLEIHLKLEEIGATPEDFQRVFGTVPEGV